MLTSPAWLIHGPTLFSVLRNNATRRSESAPYKLDAELQIRCRNGPHTSVRFFLQFIRMQYIKRKKIADLMRRTL